MATIFKSEQEAALLKEVELALSDMPFRVLDLDLRVGPRSLMRLFIDLKDPKPGVQVSIDDCVKVSKHLDELPEIQKRVPGSFDLEVSSPGLERRLRIDSDFSGVVGREVKVSLVESIEGVGANARGRLVEVSKEGIQIEQGPKKVSLPFLKIQKAHVIWDFDKKHS